MSLRDLLAPLNIIVRNFIRKIAKPKSVDEVENKRDFYSKLYLLSSFSLFTYLIYVAYKTESTEGDGTDLKISKRLKTDKEIRVINVDLNRFAKTEDYTYIVAEKRRKDEVDKKTSENENSDNLELK